MKIILASKKIIIVIEPSQHASSLFDSNCFDLVYQHIKFLRRVEQHFFGINLLYFFIMRLATKYTQS